MIRQLAKDKVIEEGAKKERKIKKKDKVRKTTKDFKDEDASIDEFLGEE